MVGATWNVIHQVLLLCNLCSFLWHLCGASAQWKEWMSRGWAWWIAPIVSLLWSLFVQVSRLYLFSLQETEIVSIVCSMSYPSLFLFFPPWGNILQKKGNSFEALLAWSMHAYSEVSPTKFNGICSQKNTHSIAVLYPKQEIQMAPHRQREDLVGLS